MFTRPDQLQRKGGPEERLSYLQKLKDEYNTTKSLEAKQQVLANLANFAYDPINYAFIKQLQIVDLFVSQLYLRQSEELCLYAVGGLCNLSNDPEIACYITTEATITSLSELLCHTNKEIVLNSLTTLYYLARSKESAHVIRTPRILNKLRSFREADLDDSRLGKLAAIFLSDIWGPNAVTAHSRPIESVEVSTQSSRDCNYIPMPADPRGAK